MGHEVIAVEVNLEFLTVGAVPFFEAVLDIGVTGCRHQRLDVIGLTEGMMPGEVGQGTLTGLVWAMGIGIVPLLVIAWRSTLKVSMTEDQLKEIQENIKSRVQTSP